MTQTTQYFSTQTARAVKSTKSEWMPERERRVRAAITDALEADGPGMVRGELWVNGTCAEEWDCDTQSLWVACALANILDTVIYPGLDGAEVVVRLFLGDSRESLLEFHWASVTGATLAQVREELKRVLSATFDTVVF